MEGADHAYIEKNETNNYNIGDRINILLNKGWRIPVMNLTNRVLEVYPRQLGMTRMLDAYATHEDLIDQNYRDNTAQDIRNTVINDQKIGKVKDMDYGKAKMGDVGCEIIAVNNALILTGHDTSMADLILETQLLGGAINIPTRTYGEFGSNPYLIDEVLKLNGAKCTEVGIRNMKQKGVYVMSFWNSESEPFDGLHTIAITSDGRGNYQPYNKSMEGADESLDQNQFKSSFSYSFITAYRMD